MSDKDVKDTENETLTSADGVDGNDASVSIDSIEAVDFAVVYDDTDDAGDTANGDTADHATSGTAESQEATADKEDAEGIATEDSVASDNANRVNETLALGTTDDKTPLAGRESVKADSATSVSSQIDREIKHRRKKDAFFFKANPTFALDHVTVNDRKTGRNVLDDVSLAFHAGATYAVLVDADDAEQHQALVATMVGMMRTTSGNVMHKSTNIADVEPLDVLGHRIGFIDRKSVV